MTPDVNVLVAAFRSGHVHHEVARAWLREAYAASTRGQARLALLPLAVAGFLRLVTNRRVFADPDRIEDAIAFIDTILAGADLLDGISWPALRGSLLAERAQGNAVTDAWLAAATEEHGEHRVTFDAGFRKRLRPRDVTVLAGG